MFDNIIEILKDVSVEEREATVNIYGKDAKIYISDFHVLNKWKRNLEKLVRNGIATIKQENVDGLIIVLPSKYVHILGCKEEQE